MGRTESCRLGGGFQYEKPRKASTAVLLDGVAEIIVLNSFNSICKKNIFNINF